MSTHLPLSIVWCRCKNIKTLMSFPHMNWCFAGCKRANLVMKICKELPLHQGLWGTHIGTGVYSSTHQELLWGFGSSMNVTDGPGDRCERKGKARYRECPCPSHLSSCCNKSDLKKEGIIWADQLKEPPILVRKWWILVFDVSNQETEMIPWHWAAKNEEVEAKYWVFRVCVVRDKDPQY